MGLQKTADLAQGFDNVFDVCNQGGTVFDKSMWADAGGVIDSAGHGHHFTILLHSQSGGDQGTTAVSGKSNITALTGVIHNEQFRKLVETAVVTAVTGQLSVDAVRKVDIAFEDSEPYPYFRSYMGFEIIEDYYQGTDVFA